MSKYLLCMGMGICLVVLLRAVEARAAEDEVVKEVDKASKDATGKKWDDLVKEEAAAAKKYDPEQVMEMMSRRNPDNPKKGGVGIGAKPGGDADGIEAKIIKLGEKVPQAADMANLNDLKKMADQVAAIAAIAHGQTHDKKKADPDGALWKKTSADMFEKARDFKKAVEAKDQAKMKAAAKALDGTCKECHIVYK